MFIDGWEVKYLKHSRGLLWIIPRAMHSNRNTGSNPCQITIATSTHLHSADLFCRNDFWMYTAAFCHVGYPAVRRSCFSVMTSVWAVKLNIIIEAAMKLKSLWPVSLLYRNEFSVLFQQLWHIPLSLPSASGAASFRGPERDLALQSQGWPRPQYPLDRTGRTAHVQLLQGAGPCWRNAGDPHQHSQGLWCVYIPPAALVMLTEAN